MGLAGVAAGQTVRTWTSSSDQRWSRGGNWSGGNLPNTGAEVAQFGTGAQLNPLLNSNSYTVRGISFSAAASGYDVGDNNGARTLKIGNGTSGFISSLSANDQTISIATLQFQSASTVSATGGGKLSIGSNLTGNNRNLTFDTSSAISVSGNITTGSGGLTKQGAGNLNLSGSNTNTGLTAISAGAIVLGASNVFADSSAISIAAGGALRLNDYADVISGLSGSGTLDFGTTGAGQLTLGAGASSFSGTFAGSGNLIIGAGATLTLGADFSNSNLTLTLDGGTLLLGGHSLTVGALSLTGSSVIDFSATANSVLAANSLSFGTTGIGLTVQNWTNAADYFYSQTGYVQGSAPLDQVVFQGWTATDTKWLPYDNQITPVPEPKSFGICLLALALVGGWWRRQRLRQV